MMGANRDGFHVRFALGQGGNVTSARTSNLETLATNKRAQVITDILGEAYRQRPIMSEPVTGPEGQGPTSP